jgi:hypothetical protein
MKTNRSARKVRKLRDTLLCLAVVGLTGMAFVTGQSLAARFGQASYRQSDSPQAPNVDLAVLMAAMD